MVINRSSTFNQQFNAVIYALSMSTPSIALWLSWLPIELYFGLYLRVRCSSHYLLEIRFGCVLVSFVLDDCYLGGAISAQNVGTDRTRWSPFGSLSWLKLHPQGLWPRRSKAKSAAYRLLAPSGNFQTCANFHAWPQNDRKPFYFADRDFILVVTWFVTWLFVSNIRKKLI